MYLALINPPWTFDYLILSSIFLARVSCEGFCQWF